MPNEFDVAVQRLRAAHTVLIEWHPGAIEWSCSCGARSSATGSYRTERQVAAAADRHLRAELRKILHTN